MTLEVDIRKRLGGFSLDVSFHTGSGLTALFGRSGAGKSTIVNIIAGLIRPDAGRVAVNGTPIVETDSGLFVPAHKRRLGYVFQEGRLFPHLSVRQNLLYGRWFAGAAVGADDDLARVLDMLGIEALLERRPAKLSGGEKQRVAIGRALLANPRLLLMDEPLASLDEARKQEILPYLERLRDEAHVPIVYVSHSVAEVARLATTIIVLSEGRVATAGTAAEVMGRIDLFPLTGRAEAGAIVDAVVEAHEEASGLTLLRSRAGQWRLPKLEAQAGSKVRVRVRARDVMLAKSLPQDVSALNVFPATIAEIGPRVGPIVDVRLDCSGDSLIARLTRFSVERLHLQPGARVHVLIKSVALDRRSLSGPWREGPAADVEALDS
jgi:molybdate transport system ATP-binding protein